VQDETDFIDDRSAAVSLAQFGGFQQVHKGTGPGRPDRLSSVDWAWKASEADFGPSLWITCGKSSRPAWKACECLRGPILGAPLFGRF
jgi:hypothetical protein